MRYKMAIIGLLLAVSSANAGDRTEEPFGLGVILGEPTGLSLKYWLDKEHAIDGAAAWSFSENDSFQLHGDYLIHNYEWLEADEMPCYYGLGARIKFKDSDGRGRNEHDTLFGIRFPLGITYLFDEIPLDVFAEIVPVLDLAPDADAALNAAIGFHFYF